MKVMGRMVTLLALAGALALPAWAQGTPAQKPEKKPETARASAPSAAARAATEDPDYVIGAEDSLAINVWKEAELSRPVQVRPDGKVTLPLLNDIQAAGLTPQQLAASITEKLKKFVSDPQVTVIVTAIVSRRIYILGEVAHSGTFPLLHGMTVLQALASAGSFSQFADTRKIYLLRSEGGKQAKYPFNYREVIKGRHQEQNIELKPGDTIVVP
jgi:polysaccharide export outer membrane protein